MPSTPIQLLVEFALFGVNPHLLQETKDYKADFLVVERCAVLPPSEGDLDFDPPPTKYTEEPLVQQIYLLNSKLLPFILQSLGELNWRRGEDQHGYPTFLPLEDRTHGALIRKFVMIREGNDLPVRGITLQQATA